MSNTYLHLLLLTIKLFCCSKKLLTTMATFLSSPASCQVPTLKSCSSYSKNELIRPNWLCEIAGESATKKTTIPLCIIEANKTCNKQLNDHKLIKRRLSQSLGFMTQACKINTARFASTTETAVKTYSGENAYLPLKMWVYKMEAIRNQWKCWLTSGPVLTSATPTSA